MIDPPLGRRESGPGDSGLSGRLYSMIAQEMSYTANRGKVIWVLASSRPDLIEVDLKRPGRIDLKVPRRKPWKQSQQPQHAEHHGRHQPGIRFRAPAVDFTRRVPMDRDSFRQ